MLRTDLRVPQGPLRLMCFSLSHTDSVSYNRFIGFGFAESL